jgi:hypothetical protein
MKQKNKRGGWLFFLFAIGLFCLQMGYFFLHSRYFIEYVDNRIFYVINILIVVFMALSIRLLLTVYKKWWLVSIASILILIQVNLLVNHSSRIKQIVSISPDLRNVLVVKENRETGDASYYRSHYGIFARQKENLPYKTKGEYQAEWLANDVAAVTYKAANDTIHQYIGTYGDRNGGISHSYVGPSIQGQWEEGNVRVISAPEGISIHKDGSVENYDWEHIVQFGTLAVVLVKNNEAVWTIALNDNFKSHSNEAAPPSGEIILYKATMENTEPIILKYVSAI